MSTQSKKIGRVRASILGWLGVPIELTDSGFWSKFNQDTNTAGQVVNDKSVMSLSAAWACTRMISESIGTLPLHMYQRTDGGRLSAKSHPLHYIVGISPNASSTSSAFWSAMVASMLLRGNAFAEIVRSGNRVVGMEFLHPDQIKPEFNNGLLTKIHVYKHGGLVKSLTRKSILHIPAFSLDGQWGMSAIAYGSGVFGSALAASSAANSTFEKGLSPTVALTIDRVIKKEQREAFRESMESVSGSINAGKTAVLEAGMDAKVIGIKPSDAQLLESRGFSVEEVCRWFGVDPSMVGHGQSVSNWGTGLEQKMIGFLTFTLRPILTRIEQAINKYLIPDIEQERYYAEFSIEALLRADSAGRSTFYQTMINIGAMTRDEVRELENLPKMGGNAEKLTIQQGFTTLDNIGREDEKANIG